MPSYVENLSMSGLISKSPHFQAEDEISPSPGHLLPHYLQAYVPPDYPQAYVLPEQTKADFLPDYLQANVSPDYLQADALPSLPQTACQLSSHNETYRSENTQCERSSVNPANLVQPDIACIPRDTMCSDQAEQLCLLTKVALEVKHQHTKTATLTYESVFQKECTTNSSVDPLHIVKSGQQEMVVSDCVCSGTFPVDVLDDGPGYYVTTSGSPRPVQLQVSARWDQN